MLIHVAVIFAGARDPSKAEVLKTLADKHPGRLHIVKLTSASEEDNVAAIKEVESKVGHLDVVIANAGKLCSSFMCFILLNFASQALRACLAQSKMLR